MKKITTLVLFIMCYAFSFAQPGGGGGMYVKQFYNSELQEISSEDFSLSIEVDGLSHDNVPGRRMQYIPPNNNHSDDQKLIHLEISYQDKTYKIDIENIMPENGGGFSETIDSIVLDRPYILSRRSREYECWDWTNDVNRRFLQFGITPYTNRYLNTMGYTYFDPEQMNNKKQLPWEKSFCEAEKKYSFRRSNEKSYESLKKALKENNNTYNVAIFNLELRILASDFYQKNIESSKTIIDLINKYPKFPITSHLQDIKAKSYIKIKQYNEALKEYEHLEKQHPQNEDYYAYDKMKVFFYQSRYNEIIEYLSPMFKKINNKYFYNITYRDDNFEQLNKYYFLYSFCSFLENPSRTNKKKLSTSLHNSEVFYLDYDFIRYLLQDFYLNTPITPEKFEGFKLLFKMSEKENLF